MNDATHRVHPADQGLHPVRGHIPEIEGGLVGEEELILLERFAQVHLELHTVLHHALHPRLEHDVAILTVPLGTIHRDIRIAQELLRRGSVSRRDPDARRHAHASLLARSELERWLERREQPLGDQLGTDLQRELLGDHDELVPTQTTERIGGSHDAVEPRGDRLQELIAGPVAERVVDVLEVVEIYEQRRDRRLAANGTGEYLLNTIQNQGAVRQPRQRVVGCQERELLLAPLELFIRQSSLSLEALAHPQNAELEAQLQYVERLRQRARRDAQLRGAILEDLSHHIAPPVTATGHLVQRRRAMGRELAEDNPGFLARLDSHLHTLPRDPPSHRDRRARANPFEAPLNHGVDDFARRRGSYDGLLEHVPDSRLQRLAKAMKVLPRLIHRNGRRQRDTHIINSRARALDGHRNSTNRQPAPAP